jgi:uroporphyrinogen decarboxylase
MKTMTMTPKERFLTAMRNGKPDRVPATPDISNYIPCKRTGLPYWDVYFFNKIPLWRAYLDAADYYGIEAWMASCTGVPFLHADRQAEFKVSYDREPDAVTRHTRVKTPAGDMTMADLCYRNDPPSPVEKPVKDLASEWPKLKHLLAMPTDIDRKAVAEVRAECDKREQALGYCIGYPGFQMWMVYAEGGVTPLAYAEMDCPEVLQEWFEWDLERGTREMELLLSVKPDYILFGGSGTITLASPDLARKYAIPALKKWSAMAKAAGVPTMLHSCGKSRLLVDMLCDETDVNCLNPLEIAPMGDVDLAEVKRARGSRMSLMGNLHTTEVMLKGTPADVRRAAIQALRDAGQGGGFILSTGDQCGRDTPEENLFALVETAHEFGGYNPATGQLAELRQG